MPTIYDQLVTEKDLLDFSQNITVNRNRMGNRLFPDRKVNRLTAEYKRLVRNGSLPTIAMVHALDTEAHIADRVPWEKVETSKLYIKEKINVSEELEELFDGMVPDDVTDFVFNDAERLVDMVLARVEKAKMDCFATGKYTITENNLDMEIDYEIPDDNFVDGAINDDANVITLLRTWYDLAEESGTAPNRIVTTRAIRSAMLANPSLQKAAFGNTEAGRMLTPAELNNLLSQHFDGMTLEIDEEKYATVSTSGGYTRSKERFFPSGKLVMCNVNAAGAVGEGLWGVTPEERARGGQFDSRREQQFITVTEWGETDPVARWTKAAGVFVPVLPDPYSHIIATVTVPAASGGSTGSDDSDDSPESEG